MGLGVGAMTEAVRRATGVSNMKGIIFIRVNIIY